MKLRKLLVEFRDDSLQYETTKQDLVKLKQREVIYDGSYMNEVEHLQQVLDYNQSLIDNEVKTNNLLDKIAQSRKEIVNLLNVVGLPPKKRIRVNLIKDSYVDFWYEDGDDLKFGNSYSM